MAAGDIIWEVRTGQDGPNGFVDTGTYRGVGTTLNLAEASGLAAAIEANPGVQGIYVISVTRVYKLQF